MESPSHRYYQDFICKFAAPKLLATGNYIKHTGKKTGIEKSEHHKEGE